MTTQRRFSIVESFLDSPRRLAEENEDRLFINGNFVAVIDGATSSARFDGVSGGALAADCVHTALQGLSSQSSARDFVNIATKILADRVGHWEDASIARPSAAVVVYSQARGEVWRIGDCHFRISDLAFPGEKEIDRIAYVYRCAVVRARLELGLSAPELERNTPTLQQPFFSLVSIQHAYCNVDTQDPLGYGAIDGRFVPDRYIETYDARAASQVVLCSDGFLSPSPDLATALSELAMMRAQDPLMVFRHRGSRPFPPNMAYFDDATYVRLALPLL